MKQKLWLAWCVALLGGMPVSGQEVRLGVVPGDGALQLSYDTVVGNSYELQRSADLDSWEVLEAARAGNGQTATHEVVPTDGSWFFRLVITETPAGLAPTREDAVELLVGETLGDGYRFQSETRFDWNGDAGNWSYEKTGPDTALLVFTYDEDGNNPDVYREEVVLTFSTPTSGTLRYSVFYNGLELPGSVSTGPFSF